MNITPKDCISQFRIVKEAGPLASAPEVGKHLSLSAIRGMFHARLGNEAVENVSLVAMNHRSQFMGYAHMAVGTAGTVTMPVREIVRVAVMMNASQIVLAHNHPDEIGEAVPSDADFNLTFALMEALASMSIQLVDHYVISLTDCESIMRSERLRQRMEALRAQFYAKYVTAAVRGVKDTTMLHGTLLALGGIPPQTGKDLRAILYALAQGRDE